jgi:putative ABC transport system ATP-binding protein
MPETLYTARDLTKTYHMGQVEVHALREVDLEVYRGELLVLLGPSGSGKSTLLNLLGGMDTPTSGSIKLEQTEIGSFSERRLTEYRRRHVGFIFQFFNLLPTLTARENVQVAADICSEPRPVDEMLEMVGLADRADHFPAQMSGGEQQRAAIARAMVKDPRIILGDEPTGALDYETAKVVLDVLRRAHRESDKTVVIVTHNTAIGRMADRVAHMRSGRITEIETNESPADPEELEW